MGAVYGLYPKIITAGMGSKHMGPHDVVGTTFFIAQNVMIAFTMFFILERASVPPLIVEFYCVLKATTKCDEGVFWRLVVASLVMLAGGYCGEVGIAASALAFGIGMAGYLYICYE